MRVMAKITLPVDSGNQAVQDGSIGKLIQSAAERWKPEAMYFGGFEGKRTAFVVFDMPDSSDMVPFAEPFFQGMNTLPGNEHRCGDHPDNDRRLLAEGTRQARLTSKHP